MPDAVPGRPPAGAAVAGGTDRALRDDLVDRLLEHCALVSVTGDEGPIADAVADRYRDRGEPVRRIGDSVVVGQPSRARPLVALVGHLDVVPPTSTDLEPHLDHRDGIEVVVARGASDMKSGNVVAMACFEAPEVRRRSPFELALVLYAGEEGPAEHNQLADVLDEVTWLREAELAVILEPTDGEVQVGCLGGLHALVTFHGRAAHSARPWHGDNALTKAGTLLAELDGRAAVEVVVDGIAFRDVWTATQAWTGDIAAAPSAGPRNVIPDRFTINLNYRFAPTRTVEAAEAEIRALVRDRAEVEVVDRVPPAPPRLDAPAVAHFVTAVGGPVTGKQAWTDIARFAQVGVAALNFGPGLTAQAHQPGEHVPVAALVDAHTRLRRFLAGSVVTS